MKSFVLPLAAAIAITIFSPPVFSQNKADAEKDQDKKDTVPIGDDTKWIRKSVEWDEKDGTHYHFTFDTTVAPDLTQWTDAKLVPVVKEWYPKLVEMLPSDGYHAPTNVTIKYSDKMGGTPAAAGGGQISCNAQWFRGETNREAIGAVVHEMVHIVQNY
ncbi:MAG TPA: hypothetical protein VI282_18890, partial [Verrucomicrobiae bacterium]